MSSDIIPTFYYEEKLPKLPIPDLGETCKRYLASLQPLQTSEQHLQTQQAVEAFQASSDGKHVQEKLIDYAMDKNSYIEEYWNQAYLNADSSVVLNLNPFFVLEDDPTPARNNQLARASSLIYSSLKFVQAVRSETLEPDVWRNTPLCMNQFRYLFGCCRIPTTKKEDEVHLSQDSKHLVVLCRNQFYSFDVIWTDGTIAVTEREILANLRLIHEDSQGLDNDEAYENAVGVLTADDRQSWAKFRKLLLENHSDNLKVIDEALFLVCLDNTSPPTGADFAATALHGTYQVQDGIQTGTCINRWYDKLQMIICENGVAAVNFEHSKVDGHTVLRFVSDVYTDTIIRFAQTIRGGTQALLNAKYKSPNDPSNPKQPDIHPRKLDWNLNDNIVLGIRYAESKLSDLIVQSETKVLEFTAYGKLFIIKNNMSPDAFIQMAFVASYYFLYGSYANTYEPVLTKMYFRGRTEAARSMTKEAAAYAKIFCQNVSGTEKLHALKKAVKAQVEMVKRCASGQGIDRHLYALLKSWEENKSAGDKRCPSIFQDQGWTQLNETILSTSNCGNPALRLFGFGPVVQNGFGIGYIIKDEGIQFCATSKHRQTTRFLDTLATYLLEVQELLSEERQTMYPNLSKADTNNHNARRHRKSSRKMGYGFFDAGSSSKLDEKNDLSPRKTGNKL